MTANVPLGLLQELLDIPLVDASEALTAAATSVARWLACEKTDVFLLDAQHNTLVAMGTSKTPLGDLQRALGLDVMPLVQGGRSVQVYQTGQPYWSGNLDQDPEELRGIVRELGARSTVIVPLSVAGARRGVLNVVSQQPERFGEDDVKLLELVSGWTSALIHRSDLVQSLREEERQRGRRMAADDIVSILAHDIWNHLNPLSARLQLMQLKLGRGEPIRAPDLDSALLSTQRLARLTQDLLDAARLDHGLFELELAPVELVELLADVARLCSTASTEVRVGGPAQLTIVADGSRLRQAVENVVLNAVRHTKRGSPVVIDVEVGGASDLVTVRVSDSGPGIRPELLPHLFERFVSEGPTRGLGLGLYLAQRIAVAHGGALQARSLPGAGAELAFSLPIAGRAAQ